MKELNISEEQLKELVLRVLSDLEAEKRAECMKDTRQTLYMLCVSSWSERYMEFLKEMEGSDAYDIVPVIPSSWKDMGYEARLRQSVSFGKILYRSGEMPDDLDRAVTLLPVVPRDVLVKTALCMEQGSRVVLLRSGLAKFSGNEKPAYRRRIMEYYRQALEFGIEICSAEEFSGRAPYEIPCEGPDLAMTCRISTGRTENSTCTREPDKKKKRVISSSNVEQFASDGVIYLQPGDIVTDLAKDRAKFLKIVFK